MNHACVHGKHIMRLPLQWIGPASMDAADAGWARWRSGAAQEDDVLPLAMLDAPCLRDIVTAALDKKGMAWRHAFNSASLSAVWAATAAGLGLSVRTPFGLPAHVKPLDAQALGLPALPSMDLIWAVPHRCASARGPAGQHSGRCGARAYARAETRYIGLLLRNQATEVFIEVAEILHGPGMGRHLHRFPARSWESGRHWGEE